MTDAKPAAGIAFGLAAVLAWAIYNIGVAEGRAAGFSVADLTLLRYLGATLALAPVALARMNRGVAMPRAWRLLVLLGLAGPHFGVLYNLGMPLTRLSHAVIISPGLSMLVALGLTALSLRQVPGAARLIGTMILLAALLTIALDRQGPGPVEVWRGDLIFVLTGTLYGSFSFLLGRWQGDAVVVTFWISALSLAIVGPTYALFAVPTPHPPAAWALQFLLQGVLGGGWAIVLYALSIRHLGADRAGIFPALVPVCAALLSLPISGTAPSPLEGVGAALAALGMGLALKPQRRAN